MIRLETVHGSCVALDGRAILILGPSGSGKSALALAMMSIGAGLVSDDRTVLQRCGAQLMADAPDAIRGRIEARGIGILGAGAVGPAEVVLVVDLGLAARERLPPPATRDMLGVAIPLVLGPWAPHLHHALRQYMLGGRTD